MGEAQLTAHIPPGSPLPAELADWPARTLDEAQLGDLELLTSGAFAPLRGFMGAADAASVAERGLLIDVFRYRADKGQPVNPLSNAKYSLHDLKEALKARMRHLEEEQRRETVLPLSVVIPFARQ